MSEKTLRLVGGGWVTFDGMTWPATGQPLHDLEYALRYGAKPTRGQLLHAASVVSAYGALVHDPERKRRTVIAAIRSVLKRKREGGH